MHKFLCIRDNKHCKKGTWFFSIEIGEPLFRARLNGPKLVQVSHVGIPFESLADYIVEPGFQLPISMVRKPLSEQPKVQEIIDFQSGVEDIVEPEVESRNKAADPSFKMRGGVVLPNKPIGKT